MDERQANDAEIADGKQVKMLFLLVEKGFHTHRAAEAM